MNIDFARLLEEGIFDEVILKFNEALPEVNGKVIVSKETIINIIRQSFDIGVFVGYETASNKENGEKEHKLSLPEIYKVLN